MSRRPGKGALAGAGFLAAALTAGLAEAQLRIDGGYAQRGGDSGFTVRAEYIDRDTGWGVNADYLRHDIDPGTRERLRAGVGRYLWYPSPRVRWLLGEVGWQGERFDTVNGTETESGFYLGSGVDARVGAAGRAGLRVRYVNISGRDGFIARPYVGARLGDVASVFVAYEVADSALERRDILEVGFVIGF